jgi:voltage-gated potassium channel
MGILLCLLGLYYAIPFDTTPSRSRWVLTAVVTIASIFLLVFLVVQTIKRQVLSSREITARVERLMALLYVVVVVFSLAYRLLAREPGQFDGLDTKTDALYFTTVTLGTVGYGDIHPVGQASRLIVTGQIAFNLVFVGAFASVLSGLIRQRAAEVRGGRPVT